jgi:hypothetical protein
VDSIAISSLILDDRHGFELFLVALVELATLVFIVI